MGWDELDGKPKQGKEEHETRAQEEIRALGLACREALKGDNQSPLKRYLLSRAHSVSYRPSMTDSEVAFHEGQRSLALQILKSAGEI